MALLFNPLTEWVDRTSLFRFWIHEKTDHSQQKEVCGSLRPPYRSCIPNTSRSRRYQSDPRSKGQIKAFVDFYQINMDEFEPSDINAYPVNA